MNSADLCRKNGWTAGTHLEGDEGHGPEIIRITAVGEGAVLAVVARNARGGTPRYSGESTWLLEYRSWKQVAAPT